MQKSFSSIVLTLFIFCIACQSPVFCDEPGQEVEANALDDQELRARANQDFYARRIKEARALCQQSIERNHFSLSHLTPLSARYFLNRTICDIGLRDFQSAKKTLEPLQSYLRDAAIGSRKPKKLRNISRAKAAAKLEKDEQDSAAVQSKEDRHDSDDSADLAENGQLDLLRDKRLALADCTFLRAELAYKTADSKEALPLYQQALASYRELFGEDSAPLSQALEGMAVCLRKEGHLGRALSAQRQAALNDYINMGTDSFRFCETLKFDIQMEHEAGFEERAQVIQDLFVASIRASFGRRLAEQYLSKLNSGEISSQELEIVKTRVKRVVIGNLTRADVRERMEKIIGVPAEVLDRSQGKPQVFDFAHWVCNRKELEAPSASVLINPEVPQIALIYCIHGLGLHGNSFSKFGQAMAERGYPVLLPDIRGFGANANRKGLDEFAPSDSLKDIHRSLASLKTFCPDLPVFILGESMGGALALQSAAQHGDLISGLICSVPSGSRFGGVQDGLRVARGLLSGKKQIDVAKMIVNRATSDQESRNRWESDPNARLELSPKELVRFQEFMDQNDKAAKSISQIPVLFLQGAKDGLVKPKGTAELYTSLASRDKDFLIVGMQEHLIFEDENFPAWIPGALSSWLEDKLKARGKFAPQ